MANYKISYSCGHTEDKQLFGKEADRQRYIAWAQNGAVCSNCRASDKAAAVADLEAEHDLPALTGSEKQIAWARTLRAERMGDFSKMIDQMRGRVKPGAETEFENTAASYMVQLAGQSAAKWWIDGRDLTVQQLVAKAMGK